MKLTDFLGHEYGPGDLVIYGAMSGRSVNMVIGRVTDVFRAAYVDYKWQRMADGDPVPRRTDYQGKDMGEVDTALRVQVQPLRGARWTQHHGHDYYVDTRTGKRIDPWRGKDYPHILVMGHAVDKRTGQPIPDEAVHNRQHPQYCPYEERKYVVTQFQPWVERRNDGPKPVTLTVTDNIVKWEGELPGEVPVQVP